MKHVRKNLAAAAAAAAAVVSVGVVVVDVVPGESAIAGNIEPLIEQSQGCHGIMAPFFIGLSSVDAPEGENSQASIEPLVGSLDAGRMVLLQ